MTKGVEKKEVAKLNLHLNLLREEYLKLQVRLSEVEKNYQVALASLGHLDHDNFVSKLLRSIAELFDSELYSDLTVELEGQTIKAHRFVLSARSDQWGLKDLSEATCLDMKDFPSDVSHTLLKWVYTDLVEISGQSDSFLLDLLRAASKYQLKPLADRCEQALTSSVTVTNCINFYQTAEQISALSLKSHCSELISNHWNDFTPADFESMPASLAYAMFKTKSQHPLHTSIRARREDVVFLYLVENSSQLPTKLDELDGRGDLPLNLALQSKQLGVAETLVKHGVNANRIDNEGYSLLHRAVRRNDDYSADFLINNGADISAASLTEKETSIHSIAALSTLATEPSTMEAMLKIGHKLLDSGAEVNTQDKDGNTPLHLSITSRNKEMFSLLLEQKGLLLEIQNGEGYTVLWLALAALAPGETYDDESFASQLLKTGSSPNAVKGDTGDTLLHLAARSAKEEAALFLAQHGGNGSIANQKGETALHLACHNGLTSLCETLLNMGANPNAQTFHVANGDHQPSEDGEENQASKQTPLHIAIQQRHNAVVPVFLDFKSSAAAKTASNLLIIPNFTLKDSEDQTVFGLALWQGFHDIAVELLSGGASINDVNRDGMTLLHQAIDKQDSSSALFLLDHQADCNAKAGNLSCLQLAIKRHLPSVVDLLCKKGANMNVTDEHNSCPLWDALETGQDDVASVLVRHGCDSNMWGEGPDACQQTLLHRAIDENNEPSACFLIRSLCDINCTRRPGLNGEGGDEARDGQTPLHMCCSWGLEKVVQCLIEHNADVNAQDTEGKTPLHIAIENQHHVIISLLLSNPSLHLMARDRQGLTPFAVAMATKNNKAAQAILDREPTSSEQFDSRGRNFLHLAIQKADIESVLFLIGVHVNVNSRIQDSSQLSPLHLAVGNGLEMIVRNLLLAGANVNDLTPRKQTALHLAAANDHAQICQVLLENNVDFDAVDEDANNSLHVAVQLGHLASVRVLLMESRINAEKLNTKGQNPMHILGQYGKDNAAAIFELFIECMNDYPIDHPDPNGNTILLLAYFNGNGVLCRAVVRAGARLGTLNKDGFSIFNTPVATKQLLFKLLDMLSKEPQWTDGDVCQDCGTKFTIKVRKHHCRHCGRLLCSRCSSKDMPIIKYNITKPVRVCEICFDVLSLGTL